jgi:hypothetical protein
MNLHLFSFVPSGLSGGKQLKKQSIRAQRRKYCPRCHRVHVCGSGWVKERRGDENVRNVDDQSTNFSCVFFSLARHELKRFALDAYEIAAEKLSEQRHSGPLPCSGDFR